VFEGSTSGDDGARWGSGGRSPITLADGQQLEVEWTRRGPHGEVTLDGWAQATSPDVAAATEAVGYAIEHMRENGATETVLAADHPAVDDDPFPNAVADALGLHDRRDLLQMRRPLPIDADDPARARIPTLVTRPIDLRGATTHWEIGRSVDRGLEHLDRPDVEAWVRVNNRSFAHHPDQGTETRITFALRLEDEYDDPTAILVADDPERPGEFAGFCWTKVHPATDVDPQLGEIYVIGIDPTHAGKGLGGAFTLAGLDRLAQLGVATGMLYVDADNVPARKLYDRLGFTIHHRRRVYSAAPS
jgi:mycothiol synthase